MARDGTPPSLATLSTSAPAVALRFVLCGSAKLFAFSVQAGTPDETDAGDGGDGGDGGPEGGGSANLKSIIFKKKTHFLGYFRDVRRKIANVFGANCC